jgi:hypothetical protein
VTRLFSTVIVLCAASLGSVQDPRGGIPGRVEDASGAVIPGVTVRVRNAETGVPASAAANQTGSFHLPFLPPGSCQVEAELTGFKKYRRDNAEVRLAEASELVAVMQLGAVNETVEAGAHTPPLETHFGTGSQGLFSNRPNRGIAPDDVIAIHPMPALNLRYGFTATKWREYRRRRGYDIAGLSFSPTPMASSTRAWRRFRACKCPAISTAHRMQASRACHTRARS